MSTLAVMKQRISAELRRSNISDAIASAISSSIAAMEHERVVFSESREIVFQTLANQEAYDGDDSAFIPRIQKIDYVKALIGSYLQDVLPETSAEIERINYNGTQTGEPRLYCYYGQQLRFSFVPSQAYTIRIGGVIRIPEPASDGEANNPWMTTAERAIRSRSKFELYTHVLKDNEMADRFHPDNEEGPTHEALRQLRVRSNDLMQQGGWEIEPTSW